MKQFKLFGTANEINIIKSFIDKISSTDKAINESIIAFINEKKCVERKAYKRIQGKVIYMIVDNTWVSIISSKRPNNVRPMQDLVGHCTWYIPENEEYEYRQCGAYNIVLCPKGIPQARNKALDHAFLRDLICIQSDDDLKSIDQQIYFQPSIYRKISWSQMIDVVKRRATLYPFMLSATRPDAQGLGFSSHVSFS